MYQDWSQFPAIKEKTGNSFSILGMSNSFTYGVQFIRNLDDHENGDAEAEQLGVEMQEPVC